MEANDRLILWALSQKSAGNLSFEVDRLSWTDELNGDLSDVQVRLKWKGVTLNGRGTESGERRSLAIAPTEALERILAYDQISGSNGVACHVSLEAAKSGALKELIERDAFLMSYLHGLPLVSLDVQAIELDDSLARATEILKSRKVEISIFGIAESHQHSVVAVFMHGLNCDRPFGLNIGLGCELTVAKAVRKGIIEILRNGFWATHKDTNIRAMDINEFSKSGKGGSKDHLALSWNQAYARTILEELEKREKVSDLFLLPDEGEFQFLELKWPCELNNPPLISVLCKNKGLQNLWWGADNRQFLNEKRWRSLRTSTSEVRLNSLPPHPIG